MDISWIVSAILCIILFYLIYYVAMTNADYWERNGVPQMKNSFFSGNTISVLLGKKSMLDIVNEVYKKFDGEKYAGFVFFRTPILVIRDPEILTQIMVKDFTYFQDRIFPLDEKEDITNAGLQNVTGAKWRVLRHKLTPTFTSGKLKTMFHKIKECSDEVVLYLKDKTNKDLEARDILFKFVLNVIGSTAFGINVDALNERKEKNNAFYQNSKDFFTPSLLFQLKFFIASTAPKLKVLLGIKLSNDSVNRFFQKLTQDVINFREKNNEKRTDFLQLMLEQKKKELEYMSSNSDRNEDNSIPADDISMGAQETEDIELLEHLKNIKFDKNAAVFSDNIITAQTFVFVSGGSETVASVLNFTLYELALNRDVQELLQQEVDTILEKHGFNYEAVRKMTYMDQVLNEVIRMRPPGGALQRVCTQEYKVPGTDLLIPKGQVINIPVHAIHNDPQYFHEPEMFNPDRFQNMEAIPNSVFMPFGSGPRLCIAMRLALLEMKIFLATLLPSYSVELSKKTRVPLQITKRSIIQQVVGGTWVQFVPRKL